MANDFRLLDLARAVAEEIHELLRTARPRLLHYFQLEESAESIPANIREAYRRRTKGERNQFLGYARGSSDEADEHLRINRKEKRLGEARYWRLHHRLRVIRKMITSIIGN